MCHAVAICNLSPEIFGSFPIASPFTLSLLQSASWKAYASWVIKMRFGLKGWQTGELEGIYCVCGCGLDRAQWPYYFWTTSLWTFSERKLLFSLGDGSLFYLSELILVLLMNRHHYLRQMRLISTHLGLLDIDDHVVNCTALRVVQPVTWTSIGMNFYRLCHEAYLQLRTGVMWKQEEALILLCFSSNACWVTWRPGYHYSNCLTWQYFYESLTVRVIPGEQKSL